MNEQIFRLSVADVPGVADAEGNRTDQADLLQRALGILNRPIQKRDVKQSLIRDTSTPPPLVAPLQHGWLVVYRNRKGVLCGGCEDRLHATVQECRWEGNGWVVHLTDGQRLPLPIIRSVAKTDQAGLIVSAWTVREHGYDGEQPT